MPFAPVHDSGIQLYYEDTGAPPNSTTYATLVLLHGGIFNGAIYRRLFPFAAKHNLRYVTVNLRDYSGSTPYSDDELAALVGDKPAQTAFMESRGLELAAFLKWYIQRENIPKLLSVIGDNSKTTGGIALLGWSWGCCIMMAFLAHAKKAYGDTLTLLESYLRAFVLYDPSCTAFGTTPPTHAEVYTTWQDPIILKEQKAEAFAPWVSGYYSHSPTILSSFATLSRDEILAGIAQKSILDPPPAKTPTSTRMSPEEIALIADHHVTHRSHVLYKHLDHSVYAENARAALFTRQTFPRLRVSLVWCDMSIGDVVLAAWDLARLVTNSWPEGGRNVEIIKVEGANHVSHWDQPERITSLLASLM